MKKTRRKKIIFAFVVSIIVIISILSIYFAIVNDVIYSSARLSLDNIAKKAINQGITKATKDKVLYDELVNITYNDMGEISLIQIKSYEANNICNDVVNSTERNLRTLGGMGIDVKSGLFSTIPILSALGGNVNLKFQQIGAVDCDYYSKFESAGINQNIHRLYIQVRAIIGVVFPFHIEKVEVVQKLLLCENVIIGEVPYTYLQSTELDSLLNLVPS